LHCKISQKYDIKEEMTEIPPTKENLYRTANRIVCFNRMGWKQDVWKNLQTEIVWWS